MFNFYTHVFPITYFCSSLSWFQKMDDNIILYIHLRYFLCVRIAYSTLFYVSSLLYVRCPHIFVKQLLLLPTTAVHIISHGLLYIYMIGSAVRIIMVFSKDNNSKSRTHNNDYHCCCTRKCCSVCGHTSDAGNYSSLINNNLYKRWNIYILLAPPSQCSTIIITIVLVI